MNSFVQCAPLNRSRLTSFLIDDILLDKTNSSLSTVTPQQQQHLPHHHLHPHHPHHQQQQQQLSTSIDGQQVSTRVGTITGRCRSPSSLSSSSSRYRLQAYLNATVSGVAAAAAASAAAAAAFVPSSLPRHLQGSMQPLFGHVPPTGVEHAYLLPATDGKRTIITWLYF